MKGDPIVIPDAKADIHTLYHKEAEAEGISSILAVPISVQEETIGILRLLTEEVRYFSEAEINGKCPAGPGFKLLFKSYCFGFFFEAQLNLVVLLT